MAQSVCNQGDASAPLFRKLSMFFSNYHASSDLFMSASGPRNLKEMCRVDTTKNLALVAPSVAVLMYEFGTMDRAAAILRQTGRVFKRIGPHLAIFAAMYILLNKDALTKAKPTVDRVVQELTAKEAAAFADAGFFAPETEEVFGDWCKNNTTQELRLAILELSTLRSFKAIPAIIFFRPNGEPRSSKMEICKALALYGRFKDSCFEEGVFNWVKCKARVGNKSAVEQLLHL